MKAIVLTYAPITKKETELLKKTDIFKIACNTYRAELKPNIRLTADDIVDKCLECDTCPVISLNYDIGKENVINGSHLPKRHTSLVSCCDYLITQRFTDILLVATNTVANGKDINKSFQNINRKGINSLKDYARIYKYSDNAIFDVPTITIEGFLTMTDENLILGTTEEQPENKLLKGLAFSDAYLYKVQTKGLDNPSIETGEILNALLPNSKKKEILSGKVTIEYNGLIITRITGVEPEKKEETPQMTYTEMKNYVKKNNIPVVSYKKEDLIEAIYG